MTGNGSEIQGAPSPSKLGFLIACQVPLQTVAVGSGVSVGHGVLVTVGDDVAVTVGVVVGVCDGEGVTVGVCDGEDVTVGV